MAFLNKYPKSELTIFKEAVIPGFVAHSIYEAKKRVATAESNGNFIEHNEFWDDMEQYTNSL